MTNAAGPASPAKIFARSTGGATWLGRKQRDALDHLLSEARVKILLGPPSSGKSSVLRLLAQQSKDENIVVLEVPGPQQSALGVLSTLLKAADFSLWTLSEIEQRNLLTVFVEQRRFHGSRVVICIDDVAKFATEAWNEIERLMELRHAEKPLIELIVAATERDAACAPLDRLIQNGCAGPTDAIHFLPAPDGQDLESYISWRLARFGIHSAFTAGACAAIARQARGRFNSINVICQCLFLHRRADQPFLVDEQAVATAVSRLAALREPETRPGIQKLRRIGLSDPQHAALPAWLVVLMDGRPEFEIALTGPTVIGRGDDADLRLGSRLISRRHAAIVPMVGGAYAISDLDSTNGVLVNGKFVKRTLLKANDIIDLGEFRVRFELRGTVSAAAGTALPRCADNDITEVMSAPDLRLASAHEARSR